MEYGYVVVKYNYLSDMTEPIYICLNEKEAKKIIAREVEKYDDKDWINETMEKYNVNTVEEICEICGYELDGIGYTYYPLPIIN